MLSRLLVANRLRRIVRNPTLVHDHDQLFEEATGFVMAQQLNVLLVVRLDQGDYLVGEVPCHVFELACAQIWKIVRHCVAVNNYVVDLADHLVVVNLALALTLFGHSDLSF